MKSKSLALIAAVSATVAFVGYLLGNGYMYSLCYSDLLSNTFDTTCNQNLRSIGEPLFFAGIAFSLVLTLLSFVPIALRAWGMFGLWFLPLASEIFIFYKGSIDSGFIDLMPDPVDMFRWTATFFVLISVLIILVSTYRDKTGRRKEPQPWSMRKKVAFWSLWILYVGVIFAPRVFDISYALI